MKSTLHYSILLFVVFLCSMKIYAQLPSQQHNPKVDLNLSPFHNRDINPEHNPGINPINNWNINPLFNKLINPAENSKINPKLNQEINPMFNQLLNPMMYKSLYPRNYAWKGLYIYDEKDNLIGFVSKPMRDVLICFDLKGTWTCYYVLTNEGTYNHFEINGEWTGDYLCSDANAGYNIFNKQGSWTGKHIK